MSDDDYGDFATRRTRLARGVAWIAIASLVLVGGGATVLALIFG